jgi:hypothetical protein
MGSFRKNAVWIREGDPGSLARCNDDVRARCPDSDYYTWQVPDRDAYM